jgi:hypothetical protein
MHKGCAGRAAGTTDEPVELSHQVKLNAMGLKQGCGGSSCAECRYYPAPCRQLQIDSILTLIVSGTILYPEQEEAP